jgi:starvation-inducible DNA-binding protein
MSTSKAVATNVVELLSEFLADHFVLYVKTQNFHWHLKDSLFFPIHEFLGNLYTELLEFIDPLGERILTLGATAPSSIDCFLKLSKIKESNPESNLQVILSTLIQDHTLMIETAKKICVASQAMNDPVTDDMITARIGYHQKTIWLLSSMNAKK